jgi:hypothetical protein
MTECLKCIIPLPIDVPIYSVEDGISVDSVIARFGGVRGALDNSETLKLIAEAVGEFGMICLYTDKIYTSFLRHSFITSFIEMTCLSNQFQMLMPMT